MNKLKFVITPSEVPYISGRNIINDCFKATLDSYKCATIAVKHFLEIEEDEERSKFLGTLMPFLEMCEDNLVNLAENPDNFTSNASKSIFITNNTLVTLKQEIKNSQALPEGEVIRSCILEFQLLIDRYLWLVPAVKV